MIIEETRPKHEKMCYPEVGLYSKFFNNSLERFAMSVQRHFNPSPFTKRCDQDQRRCVIKNNIRSRPEDIMWLLKKQMLKARMPLAKKTDHY